MKYYVATAARLLCFYVMISVTNVAISIFSAYLISGKIPPLSETSTNLTNAALDQFMDWVLAAPINLIFLAWTWDICKAILALTDIKPAGRAALQGALSTSIITIVFSLLGGSPIFIVFAIPDMISGAFWGWLIFYKLWPNLPPKRDESAEYADMDRLYDDPYSDIYLPEAEFPDHGDRRSSETGTSTRPRTTRP